ncbi:hypothetical protein D049_1263B, partial [Vibrio parahaemolyticus VPTS-2010]
NSDDTYQEMHL